jgi:hypothetical protein
MVVVVCRAVVSIVVQLWPVNVLVVVCFVLLEREAGLAAALLRAFLMEEEPRKEHDHLLIWGTEFDA